MKLVITYKPACDVCGAPATYHQDEFGPRGKDACHAHAQPSGEFKRIEVWCCSHTKKCKWQGQHFELNFVADKENPNVRTGRCPRCGCKSFYVRTITT